MKCFNHPTLDAVGICSGCSRGVCMDCVVPNTTVCSCLNCKTQGVLLDARQAIRSIYVDFIRYASVCLLVGGTLLFASTRNAREGTIDYWLLTLGVLLLGFGFFHLVLAGRVKQK
jgi:hypothetical protein